MNVEVTQQELSLLRAGLAAHSIALKTYEHSGEYEYRRQIQQQRAECRALSIRLGELQVAASSKEQQK